MSGNIELLKRLESIEEKLQTIERMVADIHNHVGFVDILSQTFFKWKKNSSNVIGRVTQAIW